MLAIVLFENGCQAGKMAQSVKALAINSEDLSLILGFT